MPYISTKTNLSVTKEQAAELKKLYGKSISIIPGKREASLMMDIQSECCMFFRGEETDCAFVDVMLYKNADPKYYNELTGALTNALSSVLNIDKGNIYIKYQECFHWGCNGENFSH